MARGSIGAANGLGAVLPPLLMELVMISACRVERPEEFEQRVVRLKAEFAAGDAATRRRLLQPSHAKERFENYDPDAPSLSDADARLLIANQGGVRLLGQIRELPPPRPGSAAHHRRRAQ